MVKKSVYVETPKVPDNYTKTNNKRSNINKIKIATNPKTTIDESIDDSDNYTIKASPPPPPKLLSVVTAATLQKSSSNASALHLIKKGTKLQFLRGIIADYSDATSIHGIKYFGARNKRWYERIIWFSLVSASMYFGTVLTLQTWDNWYNNPVIVGLAESSTPIWDIPFPTVTICPLIKYKRNEFSLMDSLDDVSFQRYLDIYKNAERRKEMSYDDLQKLEAISHVCITNLLFFKKFQFPKDLLNSTLPYEQVHGINRTMIQLEQQKLIKYRKEWNLKLPNLLQSLAPQINETLELVKWRKNELINFMDQIKYVLTDDGVCFSFNAIDDSKIFRDSNFGFQVKNKTRKISWSLEEGYNKKSDTETYPRRVLAGDVDESFYVKLKANLRDTDTTCGGKSQGFKVILHTPVEFPQVSKRFFRVPYKQIISVAVTPNMITTSPDVRNYDPEKRQCYFNNEKYLKYFQIYTQANCEHECYMNATLARCGCSKFYMPKDPEYNYCGAAKIQCYRNVRRELLKIDGFKTLCNCLPACTSISYDSEVTQSILKDAEVENGISDFNSSSLETQDEYVKSVMNIYFAKNQFLSAKRSELYGIADLIANIGGLFGLFMGVSILSIVEILYFCTLRMCINMRMRKKSKEKWHMKAKKDGLAVE